MKSTEAFKETINTYLIQRASVDLLFLETLTKENKNIDDCITYILNQVQKSGCNGFNDDEIYNMAVHYYDEDNIKAGKSINCNVVVNHQVELTKEEIAEAKQKAIDKVFSDKVKQMTTKKKSNVEKTESKSLF